MINLLPEEQNKEIKGERNYRVLLILLIYFLIFLVLFCGTLYFLNLFSKNLLEKENLAFREKKIEFSDIERRERKIIEINQALPKIDSYYQKKVRISDVLRKIYESFSENSYIESFHFTENGQGKGSVVLNGQTVDLEDLLKIEENLKNNFDNVDLSLGSWNEVSGVNFKITFDL